MPNFNAENSIPSYYITFLLASKHFSSISWTVQLVEYCTWNYSPILPLKFLTLMSHARTTTFMPTPLFLSFDPPFPSNLSPSSSTLPLASWNHEQPLSPFCFCSSALTAWWNYIPTNRLLIFHIRLGRVAREKSRNCSECCPYKTLVSNLRGTFGTTHLSSCEHSPFLISFLSQSSFSNCCPSPQVPSFMSPTLKVKTFPSFLLRTWRLSEVSSTFPLLQFICICFRFLVT